MKIRCFVKRLNATELGNTGANDTYVAIPNEVDLSKMFPNNVPLLIKDKVSGKAYSPPKSNIKYIQTRQNNQERISGLGEYFRNVQAEAGDEIVFERHDAGGGTPVYFMDFKHRDVLVFQKGKTFVEILKAGPLSQYQTAHGYCLDVVYQGQPKQLSVIFKKQEKKKRTSAVATDFYDLVIDGESILDDFSYLDYIEIECSGMHLARMVTYMEFMFEWGD